MAVRGRWFSGGNGSVEVLEGMKDIELEEREAV